MAFVFLQDKTEDCYTWAFNKLCTLYREYVGQYQEGPEVIVSDCDLGFMAALRRIFPRTPHLLCQWHINKNVLAKCKKLFPKEEE